MRVVLALFVILITGNAMANDRRIGGLGGLGGLDPSQMPMPDIRAGHGSLPEDLSHEEILQIVQGLRQQAQDRRLREQYDRYWSAQRPSDNGAVPVARGSAAPNYTLPPELSR